MTDLKNLSTIFEKRLFVIPDYQRGYAWTNDDCKDLTDDLEDLQRIQSRPGREKVLHYTGTIVVKPSTLDGRPEIRHKAETHKIFEVVDGQQRLTTLVIFLNEIARTLDNIGENESARNIKRNFVAIQEALTRLSLFEPFCELTH